MYFLLKQFSVIHCYISTVIWLRSSKEMLHKPKVKLQSQNLCDITWALKGKQVKPEK